MKRIRFNIANLLVIIFVLGVGFAAVREATDLWDAGIFTLTLVFLSVSVLLAIHRRESGRAFWIGFALFGWIYLGLTLVPSIESRLITTRGSGLSRFQGATADVRCIRRHRLREPRNDGPFRHKQFAAEHLLLCRQGQRHV